MKFNRIDSILNYKRLSFKNDIVSTDPKKPHSSCPNDVPKSVFYLLPHPSTEANIGKYAIRSNHYKKNSPLPHDYHVAKVKITSLVKNSDVLIHVAGTRVATFCDVINTSLICQRQITSQHLKFTSFCA